MTLPFRPLARLLTKTLHPTPEVDLSAADSFLQKLKQANEMQGLIITANHFSASDFQAWWIAIVISAAIPVEIHWVVTAGWTNSGWLTPVTHWLFPRAERLWGFTPMPAMPPDPADVEARAWAVRDVLHYARDASIPVVGMVPEGRDFPGGVLGRLPPGAGRFMHLLSSYCPSILPVGVWKENNRVYLKFGHPYSLDTPAGYSARNLDVWVGNRIMNQIALCLPPNLRGEYG